MKLLSFALIVGAAVAPACSKKTSNEAEPAGSAAPAPPPAEGSAGAPGSPGSGARSGSAAAIVPYTPADSVPEPIRAAIAAADRSDDDRKLDAGRKPGEMLAAFGIAPGQQVGELIAGGGYTTELLARVVGPTGKVHAQNTKEMLDKFARKPWTERTAKPVMANVVAIEQPVENPFPGVNNLDAVITVLNYHDVVWMKGDRAKMNKAVFDALKKGGIYGVVDSSAAPGSGTRDCETLHRVDEDLEEGSPRGRVQAEGRIRRASQPRR
ncbi:MAG: SAM-dependent methyltransferase [Kofleriaceae bacterium]